MFLKCTPFKFEVVRSYDVQSTKVVTVVNGAEWSVINGIDKLLREAGIDCRLEILKKFASTEQKTFSEWFWSFERLLDDSWYPRLWHKPYANKFYEI